MRAIRSFSFGSRVIAAAAVAVVGAMAVTGCSSSSADSEPTDVRTVASAYGDIEVPASPERVVAASYDTPWQLMSLGVKPAAVQDYGKWISEFTPEQQAFVDGLPTIGPYGEMNFEAIAAADPDIIVGDADEVDQAAFDRLSGIAPTVIVKGESRGDWKTITTEIAEAIGKTDVLESTRTAYEENLELVRGEYADVIANNKWIHISLGDAPGAFSVQQPTGAIGNLVVNELGLAYGPGVPTNYTDAGYESYPMEQLADIMNGVTVVLYPLNADGSTNAAVQAVLDDNFFTRLPAAQAGHVFGLQSSVTDFVTANGWLNEVKTKVFATL
ncbi:ABC transporter substrate-binding protein [Rhodococcus sp. 66b]|uniref:ABC transporter substrate-binding protein n=1 Tax=Rhodococcus sp. 66b TaxID=1945511 RepID=UPI0009BBE0D6|nr:ABC transporter substrate-binding protein [Rhodococcus sp. 66b]OQM81234.1 putative ABC transporter substrate-binding lipoprotein YhfQ [Rhodococcus sp. 66b]